MSVASGEIERVEEEGMVVEVEGEGEMKEM